MAELVKSRGYPLEAHEVTTPDGYILTIYRIPCGVKNSFQGPKPVVMLHHGLTLASSCWVVMGPTASLGFILADAGFDVWMMNTRGNLYSRGHTYLNIEDNRYWYIDIDKIALIDNPTTINYILDYTGASKLGFVGHSQGSTAAYAMLAELPEMNQKISGKRAEHEIVAHLGPIAYIDFLQSSILTRCADDRGDQFLKNQGLGEFIPTRVTVGLAQTLCRRYRLKKACSSLTSTPITLEDYDNIARTWPDGVASRNLEHWAVMYRNHRLRLEHYNYGSDCSNSKPFFDNCNQRMYNATEPPEYNLSRITAPQAFFLGGDDVMSVPQDVAEVKRRLKPGVLRAEFREETYGHMDFIWARNNTYKINITQLLLRYSDGTF